MNRKTLIAWLSLITAILLLSSCSDTLSLYNNGNAPLLSKAVTDGKRNNEVILKLVLPGETPPHYSEVMEVLNKKLSASIHVTLDIQYIPWSSYNNQLLVKMAAGEDYDFFYNGYWQNYSQILNRMGAKDVTDLIESYAPDLYKGLTPEYINSNKYNGKLYGIPIPGPIEYPQGFHFRADLAEKYGYSSSNLGSLQQVEEFLKKVLAAEKANGRVGIRYNGEYTGDYKAMAFLGTQREFVPSYDFNSPGFLLNNEPVVINQFETQQYKDFLKLKRRWWDEGLIDKDSLFSKSSLASELISDTKSLGYISNAPEGYTGENSAGRAKFDPGARLDYVSIEGEGFKMVSSFKAGNFIVITPSSRNAEKVLMFLNLLYKDKDVRDLYLYGIKGKDFIPVGDKEFKYPDGIDPSKVFQNLWWMVTPWSNARIPASATASDKKFIQMSTDPNNFTQSVISGFDFNPDPVKTEISRVNTIVVEYRKTLESGSGTDVQQNAKYKEFIDKLKKAGVDKIIDEKQRQINEFLKK
ncbi:extracellular solute-binding protein [Paenibacillus radicis (ex Xue et al. 2023)]|uniref:Extracellular solute-binding protein n=1 Tax=Paenibacillus radicis (ex Xue et al. 2023) TaxID=2972489 RepID=A0ABT1YK60_9BACL|nr:extracellular solute-binding protein [Paenibacillus radicis (ex Xue et al. 2023)]MCR8632774.1 extracellular solute-binding protein [Paenibacillus radicis (ex Xue et al. 2023)]